MVDRANVAACDPVVVKPRRRRLTSKQRRAWLLDAAAAQLREQGFDSMSMETLKDRAGVSRALLYNYFEGLDDLLVSLYTREIGELDKQIAAAAAPASGFEAKLRAALHAYFEFDEAHAGVFRQLQPRMTKQRLGPKFRDGLLTILMTWPDPLGALGVSPGLAESVARASLGSIEMLVVVWRNGMIERDLAESVAFEYSLAGLHAAARTAGIAVAAA